MFNLKILFLCLLVQLVQCCTRTTFEDTHLTALKSIDLRDEITDYNYFFKTPMYTVIPVTRITGCITSTDDFYDAVAILIRGQKVPVLHQSAVQNLPFLQSLHIESCNVESIEAGAFENLPSLTILKIEDNNIMRIGSEIFNNLLIKKLILTYNNITTIAADAFNNMPLLESIRLDNNYLSEWSPEWFLNCPRLSLISAKFNKIRKLPENAFQNVKESLEWLYLGSNFIKEIHRETFRELKLLTHVGLNNNTIDKIKDYTFLHLERLKVIDLSGTDITCISTEFLNTLQAKALLWIDGIFLNESCKEMLNQWTNDFNQQGRVLIGYKTLRQSV